MHAGSRVLDRLHRASGGHGAGREERQLGRRDGHAEGLALGEKRELPKSYFFSQR
jgi:hypothetical protein